MGIRKLCRAAAAAAAALLLLCQPCLAAEAVIGTSTRAMSPNATSQSLGARLEETALGDYVADALRLGIGADIAIVPGGMLTRSLPGGSVTRADAQGIFADDQMVYTVELTEQQLFALLEEGVSTLVLDDAERLEAGSGADAFPQVSGFAFVFDASQKAGKRVRSVTLDDGTALSKGGDRTLTAALPASMLDGSLGFADLKDLAATPVDTASELLCAHIQGQGQVEIPEVGRITRQGTSDQTLYERVHARVWLPYVIVAIVVVRLSLQRHRAREADGSRSKRYWN